MFLILEPRESFDEQFKKNKFKIKKISADGNCMFRAISYQLDGSESFHQSYRKLAWEYIRNNSIEYSDVMNTLVADISPDHADSDNQTLAQFYLDYLKKDGSYGDDLCLGALSKILNVKFVIFRTDNDVSYTIGDGSDKSILLLYDKEKAHYDCLV